MVERGDWLVPYYRGEPFFDKPALTYWLMAAAFRAFGFTPAPPGWCPRAARAGACCATVWLGAAALRPARRRSLGGIVLATTCAFVGFGRVAMSDMLLTLWSTLAMALAVGAVARGGARRAWPVALGAALGLGFLTKGPIALLLPGLGIVLAWRAAPARRCRAARPRRCVAAALRSRLVGLAGSSPCTRRLGLGRRSSTSSCARTSSASPARPTTPSRPFWFYVPHLPRRGRALVAPLPAGGLARLAARGQRPPLPAGLARPDARAAQPVARQDRLLPAAALSGRLAPGRTVLRGTRRGARASGPGRGSCWSSQPWRSSPCRSSSERCPRAGCRRRACAPSGRPRW